jgi:hypothetical protein
MSKGDTKEATQHEASAKAPTSGNEAPTLDYSESAAMIDEQADAEADAADSRQALTEEETKQKREEYEATLPHAENEPKTAEELSKEAGTKGYNEPS